MQIVAGTHSKFKFRFGELSGAIFSPNFFDPWLVEIVYVETGYRKPIVP